MVKFFLGNWGWVLAAVVALFGLYKFIYYDGFNDGKNSCQLSQATAVIENQTKTGKNNAKIDKETPYTGTKSERIDWMRAAATR